MLIAVLYKHGHVNLLAKDVYVSTIAGGLAKEPACDLAIVSALASAASSRPIARTTCAIGEISLTVPCVWDGTNVPITVASGQALPT